MRLVVLLAASLALCACSSEYRAVYQSVNAKDKWANVGSIVANSMGSQPPLYFVRNGELYLKVREKRIDWYFLDEVEYPLWNRDAVSLFLERHNELTALFPADWNDWLPEGYAVECKPGRRIMY